VRLGEILVLSSVVGRWSVVGPCWYKLWTLVRLGEIVVVGRWTMVVGGGWCVVCGWSLNGRWPVLVQIVVVGEVG
jgi:hypothetical protein